jgi:hypothetical protein
MIGRTVMRRSRAAALVGIAALICTGCAAIEQTEVQDTTHLLVAAGFQPGPAGTRDAQAQLAALPAHKLVAAHDGSAGASTYLYADPDQCKCVYAGSASAYREYQALVSEQRSADERELAQQTNPDATENGATWSPAWQSAPLPTTRW